MGLVLARGVRTQVKIPKRRTMFRARNRNKGHTPKSKKWNPPKTLKFKPHKGLTKRVKVVKGDDGRTVFKRWHSGTKHNMGHVSTATAKRLKKPVYIKSGSQNRLFRKLLGLRL